MFSSVGNIERVRAGCVFMLLRHKLIYRTIPGVKHATVIERILLVVTRKSTSSIMPTSRDC